MALVRALREPAPRTPHAALAWLYRMFSMLQSMFRPLPELKGFEGQDDDLIFRVVSWDMAHAEARRQLAGVEDPDSRALYEAQLEDEDRIVILGHRESKDPDDVDLMISVLCEDYPGRSLTLMGPGVALRLNRRARRAARARVRRVVRRDRRARAAQRRERGRRAKQDIDRACRANAARRARA